MYTYIHNYMYKHTNIYIHIHVPVKVPAGHVEQREVAVFEADMPAGHAMQDPVYTSQAQVL